jgi:hypothetical protein
MTIVESGLTMLCDADVPLPRRHIIGNHMKLTYLDDYVQGRLCRGQRYHCDEWGGTYDRCTRFPAYLPKGGEYVRQAAPGVPCLLAQCILS